MKKLVSMLLALSLLIAGAAALAEGEEALTFGYLAPEAAEGERGALCAEAFAYAAERKGVETVRMTYIPEDASSEAEAAGKAGAEAAEAPEATEAPEEDAAMLALEALLEGGLDGVVVAPENLEQAVEMAECAEAQGVPVVIEGIDMTPAYEPTPDPEDEEPRPYAAAVCYADAAAYAAAMWLDGNAESPLALHCALPEADPALREGLERALGQASYLEIGDEIAAGSDSPEGGRKVVNRMFNSYTLFSCVLADSAALAEGCVQGLRDWEEDMPVAAIASSADDLKLLDGDVDMLAAAPASVEGVECFKALYGFVTEGILPEDESRVLHPAAITATAAEREGWIAPDDFAAAYALAYPEEALPEEAASEAVSPEETEEPR